MKQIILAGGGGSRLWPVSRNSFPKQFLHFGDKQSLLQKTVLRFYPAVAAKDILIVTNQDYYHLALKQLKSIDPAFEKQILVEPERKNTAPAIALAVKYFQEVLGVGEDESFLVSSADHVISPESTLLSVAREEESLVSKGHHLVFGIRPHKPETGYGYIKTGEPEGKNCLRVERFVEKPDLMTAQNYLLSGGYLWNAGMFLFHFGTFLKEMELHCPSITSLLQGTFQETIARFSEMPDLSIDYALLEKSQSILVAPLDITWSDVGSWDSVYDLLEKDTNKNVKVGNVLDVNTNNCLIMGDRRLISTIGLDDLIIIDTEDALLIGKKGESQAVKQLAAEIKRRGAKEASEHVVTQRPWGSFTVLEEGERFKIKRILVEPEQRLSLQKHYHRNEHWVVVKGTAKVTVGEKETFVHENESVYISKSQVHRLENPGKVPLEVIEVQVGEYVGEDDIVRIEDIYQRV